MPQIRGAKFIGKFENLNLYGKLLPAKKRGKNRLWIRLRQDKPKEWRIAASLCYVNAFDIRFEK